jgi:hypothetical protein
MHEINSSIWERMIKNRIAHFVAILLKRSANSGIRKANSRYMKM